MSDVPKVSVVIASHGRPQALARCLAALRYQVYPRFEIIAVAEPETLAGLSMPGPIKTVDWSRPGISAARNAGLAQAAGDIVAFLDDDAIADPYWLSRLVEPMNDARIGAVGGAVRGKNGISLQWRGGVISSEAKLTDAALSQERWSRVSAPAGCAAQVRGANMAFRRDAIVAMGGFDPVYRYHLEESDLNMRLTRAGWGTAYAPLAQVHHETLPSVRRDADRMPLDLWDIGASTAVFLRKFCDPDRITAALRDERDYRARWLWRHGQTGRLEGPRVRTLLDSFDAGVAAHTGFRSDALPPLAAAGAPFRPFPAVSGPIICLGGFWGRFGAIHEKARVLAGAGVPVMALFFAPSARAHRRFFHPDGYWCQVGGLYGRSIRETVRFAPWRMSQRLQAEATIFAQSGPIRLIDDPYDAASAQ